MRNGDRRETESPAEQKLRAAGVSAEDIELALAARKARRNAPPPKARTPTPELDAAEAEAELAVARQLLILQAAHDRKYLGWARALRPGAAAHLRDAAVALTETAKNECDTLRRLQGTLLNLRKARDHTHRLAVLAEQRQQANGKRK